MNIEIYSLKRHEQNSKTVLKLMREACFKHGEKDALRSCVKAINFCFAQSRGELKYFAQNKLKELEDELIAKLKSAIKEVPDGDDAYFLVILKRLYELQLSKPIPIEGVYEDIVNFLQNFRNMGDGVVLLLNMYLHVVWCMHSIINNETVPAASISSLWDKQNTLFVQLEHYLEPSSDVQEGGNFGNLLACRVCTILAESWWELCEKHLNISDEAEDEDANKEYVEETNRDAVIIAAAKLVAIDAVPKKYLGSEIIYHFMMHGTNVVKIVKHLIVVLKKKDDNVSCIFLEALKRAYRRHLVVLSNSNYEEDASLKSFQECKDLAAQLSGTVVGAAQSKHKADILKIVKDGVGCIYLAFLESYMIASSKLDDGSDI